MFLQEHSPRQHLPLNGLETDYLFHSQGLFCFKTHRSLRFTPPVFLQEHWDAFCTSIHLSAQHFFIAIEL